MILGWLFIMASAQLEMLPLRGALSGLVMSTDTKAASGLGAVAAVPGSGAERLLGGRGPARWREPSLDARAASKACMNKKGRKFTKK